MDKRILTMHRTQVLNEEIAEMRMDAAVTVGLVKTLYKMYWRAECGDAMATLKEVDPQGWERWYDMEVSDGDYRHITEQVRERIKSLRIMHEGSASVAGLSLLAERKGVRVIYGRDKKELLGL